MTDSQKILAVINQLRELFLDKSELRGYDDWDNFLGCIKLLENIAIMIQDKEQTEAVSE